MSIYLEFQQEISRGDPGELRAGLRGAVDGLFGLYFLLSAMPEGARSFSQAAQIRESNFS
jgi:hypothetical protein